MSIKKVGIIAKSKIAKRQHNEIKSIVSFLKRKKKSLLFDSQTAKLYPKEAGHTRAELLHHCDLVIILGGDGTILKTAGQMGKRKVLVLGVNYGNLGFLAEIKPSEIKKSLTRVFKKDFVIDKRPLLRVTHYRNGKKGDTHLAMNDAVINQGMFARLIELDIEVGGKRIVDFKADGLIIATPTGSTAHSLSAGGPIVHPDLKATVVTPICPAPLTLRPIVIPNDRDLKITVITQRRDEHNLGLTIDGQITIPLEYGDIIKARRSSRSFHMIRFKDSDYFHTLRQKLGWGHKLHS